MIAWLKRLFRTQDFPEEVVEEARKHPGGWVYVIDGDYGPEAYVPYGAIEGAWKVDADGVIVPGSYEGNPNYQPELRGKVFRSPEEDEQWCAEHDG